MGMMEISLEHFLFDWLLTQNNGNHKQLIMFTLCKNKYKNIVYEENLSKTIALVLPFLW